MSVTRREMEWMLVPYIITTRHVPAPIALAAVERLWGQFRFHPVEDVTEEAISEAVSDSWDAL